MNTPFEFLGYEAVENDKFLGIATIRAWGKIILKYKVTPGKDGHGFFCSEASIKNGVDTSTGKDNYEKCWMLESNYDNELLKKFLKANVNPYSHMSPAAQNCLLEPIAPPGYSYASSHANMSVAGNGAISSGSAAQAQHPGTAGKSKVEDDFPF